MGVLVARPVDGITINSAIEYLLDENGQKRVFEDVLTAEAFMLDNGYNQEYLGHLYFLKADKGEY